jgi:hypothetical protein
VVSPDLRWSRLTACGALKVITTYNVSRIGLDIEENSLTSTAGINRCDQAVARTESWAASNGRSIQFSYTMPSTTGMDSSDEAVRGSENHCPRAEEIGGTKCAGY